MVDIDEILARGGAQRIGFLRYCVLSISMEPVFIFLAQEFRLRPNHASALALFDLFCAQQAPARLPAHECLPPRELLLAAAIGGIRAQWMQMQSPAPPDEETALAIATPARTLFDAVVSGVRSDAHGRLARLSAAYDPLLTPEENLPGQRINAGQRQFVERVWQPIVKPQLVHAGFWQLSTIG